MSAPPHGAAPTRDPAAWLRNMKNSKNKKMLLIHLFRFIFLSTKSCFVGQNAGKTHFCRQNCFVGQDAVKTAFCRTKCPAKHGMSNKKLLLWLAGPAGQGWRRCRKMSGKNVRQICRRQCPAKKHIFVDKKLLCFRQICWQNVRQNVKQNMLFGWQAQPARPGGAAGKRSHARQFRWTKGPAGCPAKCPTTFVGQNRCKKCSTMHTSVEAFGWA